MLLRLHMQRLEPPCRGNCAGGALAMVLTVVCALGAAAQAQAGWSAPVAISGRGVIGQVAVAVNGGGDAIAVWYGHSSTTRLDLAPGTTRDVVSAAYRPSGGAWQMPVSVGMARGDSRPRAGVWPVLSAAIGPRGQAVVVWSNPTLDGTDVIRAAVRPTRGGWEKPIVLDSGAINAGSYPPQPHVAFDQLGNAIAIWPGAGGVRVAMKSAGKAWRGPVTIASDAYPATPRLAFDPRGDAVAVWSASGRRGRVERSAFRPAGGGWHAAVTIGAGGWDEVSPPQVALDPHGNAVAAWTTGSDPDATCCPNDVRAAYRPAAGRWQTPVTLQRSAGSGSVRVALDRHGNAIAVWSSEAGGPRYPSVIRSAFRPARGPWRKPVTLAGPPPAGPSLAFESPRLAVDTRGDALAVWTANAFDQSIRDVQAAMRSPQGGWQRPIRLGRGMTPDAASDARGNMVVVWIDPGDIHSVVEAATFARTP